MSSRASETDDGAARALALAAALVVLGTVLTVFYGLTAEFGGTPWLVGYVGAAFLGATLAGRRAPTRVGVVGAAVVVIAGFVGYLVLLPPEYYGLFSPGAIVTDLVGWLTGRSVVLMLEADLWAVSVAPAPVFLVWYLAQRGRYDGAALAGAAAVGFFVLTGDLDDAAALVGTAGLLGLVGFGAVAAGDGDWRQIQEVGLVVGLALLLTRFVRIVPAASGGSADGTGGDGVGGQSLERDLLSDPDRMVVGSRPGLTPTPRFTVRAERRAYWHTRSFDHYDGQGWRRTDRSIGVESPLELPPSGGTTLQQSFTVESPTGAMPAAWKPVALGSTAQDLATVADTGNLEPSDALGADTTYEVVSQVPSWTEAELAAADGDHPPDLAERYTQLPGDLPDRLVEKADEIAADAEGPYETALALQGWLEAHKEYNLSVERNDWDIADAFVFALDSGYCVYFATAMAVMLRTQGVPARFTVGYAPGERVSDGEWLVRGLHSHAWVEIYFEDVGWVTFDPTPSGPRQRAREQEIERSDATAVTPGATDTSTPTPTASSTTEGETTPSNGTVGSDRGTAGGQTRPGDVPGNGTAAGLQTPQDMLVPGQPAGSTGTAATTTPAGRTVQRDALWVLGALATLAFGSVRLGYAQSALRTVWLRWQPRSDDPDADVERALARMEFHLESRFRPREEGETHQQYLASLQHDAVLPLDDRAWRVLDAHQRSRYGDGVDREEADEVIRLVDRLIRDGR